MQCQLAMHACPSVQYAQEQLKPLSFQRPLYVSGKTTLHIVSYIMIRGRQGGWGSPVLVTAAFSDKRLGNE